jgi:hypothetical protein
MDSGVKGPQARAREPRNFATRKERRTRNQRAAKAAFFHAPSHSIAPYAADQQRRVHVLMPALAYFQSLIG